MLLLSLNHHVDGHGSIVGHLHLVYVLLEVLHLLKLLLVQMRWSCDLALRHRDASREISKLVQLVKVLGTIEQDLLVICQVVIGVQILIT